MRRYNKTAALFADKLRKAGYRCKFNFIDDVYYEDVTVGPLRGYGGEYSTPRKAWEYLRATGKI